MTPGLRTHKRASLRIADPTGIPEDMRDGMREILSLQSEDRGKGHAKALMHQVCAEADRHNIVLLLQPQPFAEGMTQERLEKFYESVGFRRIQERPVLMARQVQAFKVAYG